MYEVRLINGYETKYINVASIDCNSPRITGSIKKGINSIDSFTFDIYPNNEGYNVIYPLATKVEVVKELTDAYEFKGRVLLPTPKLSDVGELKMTVVCESDMGYLMDSITRYGEYHDISVRDFLSIIIDNHNSQVSEDKQFILGEVEVTGSLYRFLGYEKTFTAIKDKLIDRLGGELQIRYENGVRYLDYLIEIGQHSLTDIRVSKNLKTIEQERDPSQIITRLLPLGAKHEDSDERLTVSSVNGGVDYIDDDEAIAEFGIIEEVVTWDDVNYPDILLTKANQYLAENNKILKKHKLEAYDLSLIGLDIDSFTVGNYHPVINPLMNIDEELRIIEKTIAIESPEQSSLTVGDKFEDIKDYQLAAVRTSKEVTVVKNTIQATVKTVGTLSTELTRTVESLQGTNANLVDVIEVVKTHGEVMVNILDTLDVQNKKLDRMNKRLAMGV